MRSNLYMFFYVLSNIFRTFDIYLFYETFLDTSRMKKSKVVSYILFYFLISGVHLFVDVPMLTLVLNLLCCFGLTFFYHGDVKKRLLCVGFIIALLCISENFVVVLTGLLSFSPFERSMYQSIFGVIMVPIVPFIFIQLYRMFKKNRTYSKIPMSYCIMAIAVPALCSYISIVGFMIENIRLWQMGSIVVIMLAIMVLVFVLYERQMKFFSEANKKKVLEVQNDYYQKQLEYMMSAENATKRLRHDMKNHLVSISALAQENEDEVVVDYVDDLYRVFSPGNGTVSTGHVVIDSMLNNKIMLAAEQGIKLQADVAIPKKIAIGDVDLTILLGNLLDNAIENFDKEAGEDIGLELRFDKGRLFITCENPYKGMRKRKSNLYDTSKANKKNHGYGLSNICNVVEKYNGEIKIQDENNIFCVELLLYPAPQD